MKYELYAVMDVKAIRFGPIMMYRTRGECIRALADAVNAKRDDNLVSSHPQDFAAYQLGTFDDETGELSRVDGPLVHFVRLDDLRYEAVAAEKA